MCLSVAHNYARTISQPAIETHACLSSYCFLYASHSSSVIYTCLTFPLPRVAPVPGGLALGAARGAVPCWTSIFFRAATPSVIELRRFISAGTVGNGAKDTLVEADPDADDGPEAIEAASLMEAEALEAYEVPKTDELSSMCSGSRGGMGLDPEEVEPLSRMECPGWSFVAWTVIELRRKSDIVVEYSAKPEIRTDTLYGSQSRCEGWSECENVRMQEGI